MKIKSVYIENIQSIKKFKIDLEEGITRIQGRNTSGKSCIKKSIELFSGNYTRQEVKGLVRKQKRPGDISRVSILLEDNTVLTAIINNNYSVDYIHTDLSDRLISKWNKHSEEILELLGWKNVEDEKVCLNVKESDIHLFINTKPATNGVLVDYLCRDKDIELKIANLEQKEDELKELSKDVTYYLNDISEEFRVYPDIDKIKFDIVTKSFTINKYKLELLNKLIYLHEDNNKKLYLHYKKEILNKIILIKALNILKICNKLKKNKEKLDNIKIKLSELKICENLLLLYYKNIKLNCIIQLKSILYNLNTLEYYDEYNKIIDKINNRELSLYKNKITRNNILNYLVSIRSLNNAVKLNKINKYSKNYKNKLGVINNIVYLTDRYRLINKYLEVNSKYVREKEIFKKLNISLHYIMVFYHYKNMDKHINSYKESVKIVEKLKNILKLNNKCPTCGSDIDIDKYNIEI